MDDSQVPRPAWNPLVAFALVLGVFFATFFVSRLVPASVTARYPWARQAVAQGLMTVVALGLGAQTSEC